MDLAYINAFIVGIFSTLHCLGMCGGVIGALTLSLPNEIRSNRLRVLPFVSAYNLGRITSYTLAGALAGAFGETVLTFISPYYGHTILLTLATILMIGIGLYLGGWLPIMARIEKLGQPIWRRIEPLGRRWLPVSAPWQAYLFGLVWGWLPCSLVYGALIWSSSSGSAANGALFMLSFGAGTLPTVMGAGILTGWMTRLSRHKALRPAVGISIIVMALVSLVVTLEWH